MSLFYQKRLSVPWKKNLQIKQLTRKKHDIILLSMKFPWFCFWIEGTTLEELKRKSDDVLQILLELSNIKGIYFIFKYCDECINKNTTKFIAFLKTHTMKIRYFTLNYFCFFFFFCYNSKNPPWYYQICTSGEHTIYFMI